MRRRPSLQHRQKTKKSMRRRRFRLNPPQPRPIEKLWAQTKVARATHEKAQRRATKQSGARNGASRDAVTPEGVARDRERVLVHAVDDARVVRRVRHNQLTRHSPAAKPIEKEQTRSKLVFDSLTHLASASSPL